MCLVFDIEIIFDWDDLGLINILEHVSIRLLLAKRTKKLEFQFIGPKNAKATEKAGIKGGEAEKARVGLCRQDRQAKVDQGGYGRGAWSN